MPVPIPAIVAAASALAPTIIDRLLAEGLPAETSAGGIRPSVSRERLASRIKKMQRRGMTQEQIAKTLGAAFGKRKSVMGMRPPSKLRSFGGKAMLGMNAAFIPIMLAQMGMSMFGGGEGGEDDLAAMGISEPGMGGLKMGEEGNILGLLGALQQQAQGSEAETRSEFARTQAGVNMLDRMDMARATPTTLGMGRASALEELIRGQEDELARMSYNEPMTLAQAYAMQGLYRPMEQGRVDFRDLI